jgi:hypothetical protein
VLIIEAPHCVVFSTRLSHTLTNNVELTGGAEYTDAIFLFCRWNIRNLRIFCSEQSQQLSTAVTVPFYNILLFHITVLYIQQQLQQGTTVVLF